MSQRSSTPAAEIALALQDVAKRVEAGEAPAVEEILIPTIDVQFRRERAFIEELAMLGESLTNEQRVRLAHAMQRWAGVPMRDEGDE